MGHKTTELTIGVDAATREAQVEAYWAQKTNGRLTSGHTWLNAKPK